MPRRKIDLTPEKVESLQVMTAMATLVLIFLGLIVYAAVMV